MIACEAAISMIDRLNKNDLTLSEADLSAIIERGVSRFAKTAQSGHTNVEDVLPYFPELSAISGVALQGLTSNPQCFRSIIEQAGAARVI
jgi:hypothetical protein